VHAVFGTLHHGARGALQSELADNKVKTCAHPLPPADQFYPLAVVLEAFLTMARPYFREIKPALRTWGIEWHAQHGFRYLVVPWVADTVLEVSSLFAGTPLKS
jgi:hypothetical protein